jgi:antitoxin component YwqK of YwqJK toxin-antitoxin module
LKALILFAALVSQADASPYKCGETQTNARKYGKVQLRVECSFQSDPSDNNISVLEFKGEVQHGISIHYDSLWRKHDSCFFVNGKEDGNLVFWDTAGNVVGRETFKNGVQVGLRESYFSPGHPSLKKNYNSQGKADGVWQEWYKNGNMKGDFIAKNGQIISGTEYYPGGKPRIKYLGQYSKKPKGIFETVYLEGEAWTPEGKSTGKIVNGNGSWVVFANDSAVTGKKLFRETYIHGTMAKVDTLTAAEILQLKN